MKTVHTVKELREMVAAQRRAGRTTGFVPTMGNLHQGHISLVEQAKEKSDFVVCSIFVNPTQFGAGEDFSRYPRTLADDSSKLAAADCDVLFAPDVDEVYPQQSQDWVDIAVTGVSKKHCGSRRAGHFEGVALVVTKLFNMVQPDVAVFGKKDFQQLAVIRRLTTALNFPIEIIGSETVREPNGLAMSSRNGYLSAEQKDHAAVLYQQLCKVKHLVEQGRKDFSQLAEDAERNLADQGLIYEYFNIADQDTLQLADSSTTRFVILTAAKLDSTRLIDNIDFEI
ncbi:MAG: pantoate--beta-alanine ligase [Gammaproteobacteria bacterium]|nr:MAG: pantoate--beta-alanine ligase [Gammaproteobacteria bacterium]